MLDLDGEAEILVAAVCWVLHCSGSLAGQKCAPTPTAVGARSSCKAAEAHERADLKNATKNATHHPSASIPA